ncbi:MAG: ABC transporter permease [Clostridiales bacterium]|nr:ABC transporter permease [Clostridiales bacterium]
MKSILSTCAQDFKRLLTNALFWVLTATLAVIVLVVDLALPKEVALESAQLLTLNAPADVAFGVPAESEAALRDAVRQGDAIGFLFGEDGLTIVNPGYSEKSLNVYVLELMREGFVPVQTESLDASAKEIPFNLRFTPVFICFEALMTGFILGGALMLAEKQDGTVKALRISPLGAHRYILAKTLLFSLIGTLYATLICLPTVGGSIDWGAFLLLSFCGTAVFTMIGLAYTTPFRDMSSWFFSMVVLLSVNMLPTISYTSPAFTPFWMRLIPSYPILMAYRAAMFGGSIDWGYTVVAIAAWAAISYLLALWFVSKRHLRGARV